MTPEFEQAQSGHPQGIQQVLMLLGPPLVVLADQLISYAIVHPVCEGNERWTLFLPSLGAAVVILLLGLMAWRRVQLERAREAVTPAERGKFISGIAVASAAFSLLIVIGFVIAKAVISPCDR